MKNETTNEAHALPRGTGSVQLRRRSYWMIYTNEFGERIQESTGLTDRDAAERLLIERAIGVLEARVAILKGLTHETAKAESASARRDEARNDDEHAARRRPVRDDASKLRAHKAIKGGRR